MGRPRNDERMLYIKITTDRFELPIAVFDTLDELARFEGVKPESIRATIAQARRHGYKSKYVILRMKRWKDEMRASKR